MTDIRVHDIAGAIREIRRDYQLTESQSIYINLNTETGSWKLQVGWGRFSELFPRIVQASVVLRPEQDPYEVAQVLLGRLSPHVRIL